MPTPEITAEIFDTWTERLTVLAEDLDLTATDTYDRAIFFVRVLLAVRPDRVATIRAVAIKLGKRPVSLSRAAAAHALARAWVNRVKGTNVSATAAT